MTRRFLLGGVEANEAACRPLNVSYVPVTDAAEVRTGPTGTAYRRHHWRKAVIRLTGAGMQPLHLPGVDYSVPLDLVIRDMDTVNADGTSDWSDHTWTVLARPPEQSCAPRGAAGSWSLECVEVDATVLHSLPFQFSLGGVTPHALAQLDFNQARRPIVGGALLRMGSGAGQIREHWRKTGIELSGGGWVPLNGLDGLDYSTPKTLLVSKLSSIDGDGNPSYTTDSYSVSTPGPGHDWDLVSRLYAWTLRCEEV